LKTKLAEGFSDFADNYHAEIFSHTTFERTSTGDITHNFLCMKKYFTEKNALTVVVSIFCFIMMIIAFVKDQSLWQGIAFGLAFSFSVELICHRAKESS
jgi:hypothetical protein